MILIFYLFVAYSILHIEKIINNVIIKKGGNMFGRWKYLILAVFAFITIACGIMIPFVNINYDNSKYLPADNKIKEGLDLLESEFGSSGYLLVMVEGVANAERINELKELISVDDVNHIDYRVKDDKVLMQVVLAESDYSARTQEAIGDIVKRLDEAGYNYYMSGQSYLTYYFNQMVKKQLPRILLIIIPIVFLILTLMTTSFIEPALFAVVTGVAIVLGMGTNIIFPEISYLTYAVSPVLQLALCMDYSIIMFSRYRHYRKQNLSRNEALTKAWKTSLVPVLASSLTTVAGFVAIMFMKYRIGADVGLVLAKAILFSLITVIFMLPALIILFDKLIEKTSHRSFFSLLKKDRGGLKAGYNKYIFRSRFVVPALALVIICVAFFLQLNTKYIYSDTAPTYDLKEIKESRDNIKDNFGLSNQAVILIKRDRDIVPLLTGLEELRYEGENYITSVFAYTKQYTKEELKHYLKDYEIDDATLNLLFNYVNGSAPEKTTVSFKEIAALIDVTLGFETELSAIDREAITSQFMSEGYQRVVLTVDLEDESETSFGFFTELENLLEEEAGEYYLISSTATIMAIKESSSRDHIVTLAISVGLIFLIIALSFKSLFAPLLLIVVIQGAIFINMAIANVAGTRIIFLGYLIVNCIQLGATIDYGILYTDRYLSHRGKSSRAESVANATSEALPTIMTSGLILFCAGMVLSAVSGIPVVALMGRLIGVGGLISVAMILFVLPQTLLLADRVLLKKGAN